MVRLFTISTRHVKAMKETKNIKKDNACIHTFIELGAKEEMKAKKIPQGKEM